MKVISAALFGTLSVFYISCNDPIERRELNRYKAENRYVDRQDLVTQTAFLAMEIDGKLKYDFKGNLEDGSYASGFLISRKRGLFKTAYHFSQLLGENGLDWCRLFINGRVYRAGLHRASASRDSAVLKILDKFNEADFPEPPVFADERPRVGDKVSIEGYHPHPYYVRLKDEESGKKFQLIPLLKNYYQTVRVDMENYTEIVYEILEARVVEVDSSLALTGQKKEEISVRVQGFYKIKTKDDHFFIFGGLSGTLVRNDQGEIIGDVKAEQIQYGEQNKIIYVTPIKSIMNEIEDLLDK